MRRYWMALLLTAFVACSFDWDSKDPRLAPPRRQDASTASTGGNGGSGGASTSTSTASSSSTGGQGGAPAVCGDGTLAGDEQCDDGNTDDGDVCDGTCRVECPGILNPQTFHCYVIVETQRSWQNARNDCIALGGGFDLVAVSSQAEYDWFIALPEFTTALLGDEIWMGGNDQGTEGTFVHSNGEPWLDDFWASGQPDNYLGPGGSPSGPGEDCVHMRDPAYNDLSCGQSEYYACERHPTGR